MVVLAGTVAAVCQAAPPNRYWITNVVSLLELSFHTKLMDVLVVAVTLRLVGAAGNAGTVTVTVAVFDGAEDWSGLGTVFTAIT